MHLSEEKKIKTNLSVLNMEIKEAKVGVAALVPETGSTSPPMTTWAREDEKFW